MLYIAVPHRKLLNNIFCGPWCRIWMGRSFVRAFDLILNSSSSSASDNRRLQTPCDINLAVQWGQRIAHTSFHTQIYYWSNWTLTFDCRPSQCCVYCVRLVQRKEAIYIPNFQLLLDCIHMHFETVWLPKGIPKNKSMFALSWPKDCQQFLHRRRRRWTKKKHWLSAGYNALRSYFARMRKTEQQIK